MFPGEWYVSSGFLYAGAADNSDFRPEQYTTTVLEPNRLMPLKWSALVMVSKPITPILNGSMTVVWSPKKKLLILMPTMAYNIRENCDLDLTGQLFSWEPQDKPFANYFDYLFLRLRWSF
jgi:hypothetical protein